MIFFFIILLVLLLLLLFESVSTVVYINCFVKRKQKL